VKVDDQAYGSLLDGVSGGEEFVAMWDGMTRAANEVFADNKVIHCMAHYERTFNGDIGMGVATQGRKIVIRNSDDFGLNRPDIHSNHIHYNIYNAMLISQLCLIPDPDMFMTSSQWPEYHAVLRAFFEGPILLADKPGQLDLEVLNKLVGRSTTKSYEVVRAPYTIKPLSRNVWERCLDWGAGPAIKGVSYFPNAGSASLVLCNARKEAADNAVDIIFECDLIEALEGIEKPVYGDRNLDVAVWLSNASTAKSARLRDFEQDVSCETTSSPPVISTLIGPQCVETLTIAPYHDLSDTMVACLGLIDKYAGLAAIQGSQVTAQKLSINFIINGVAGFLITLEAEDVKKRARVTIDNISTPYVAKTKGNGLCLIEVDLTSIDAVLGKESWTVSIQI
jgi:hypothetical protein